MYIKKKFSKVTKEYKMGRKKKKNLSLYFLGTNTVNVIVYSYNIMFIITFKTVTFNLYFYLSTLDYTYLFWYWELNPGPQAC